MGKIKVLHIIEALGGGIYSYFTDLTKHFGNEPFVETYIAYSDNRKEIDPTKIKTDFHANTKLIGVTMKKEISPFSDLKSTIRLIRLIQKINPQIIHLHSSKASVIGRLAHFISRSKAQLFYTPHGYSFLRKDISKSKRSLYKSIERNMLRYFGGITIACGDTELEYAKKIGAAILIRNGINIPEIRLHKTPYKSNKLTIGILGRITHARNPDLFNQMALKFPKIRFKWIGDGELRNRLTAPNIEITGWFTDRKKGLLHLNNLDVYLQTSLWEGLPISVLEAMAMEKPILATNIIGNRDVVLHGKTGYLFEGIEEVSAYIKLLEDESHRSSLGRKSYERIIKLFDCQKNFYQLSKIYQQDCSNKY